MNRTAASGVARWAAGWWSAASTRNSTTNARTPRLTDQAAWAKVIGRAPSHVPRNQVERGDEPGDGRGLGGNPSDHGPGVQRTAANEPGTESSLTRPAVKRGAEDDERGHSDAPLPPAPRQPAGQPDQTGGGGRGQREGQVRQVHVEPARSVDDRTEAEGSPGGLDHRQGDGDGDVMEPVPGSHGGASRRCIGR